MEKATMIAFIRKAYPELDSVPDDKVYSRWF